MASITAGGSASESTFSPTDKAVLGLTFLMTFCICSTSVQSCSSPNVSNRKMDFPAAFFCDCPCETDLPSSLLCDCPCEGAKISIAADKATVEKKNRDMVCCSSCI